MKKLREGYKITEVGEIPSEWNIVKLKELISIKHGYAFKGEYITDNETNRILVTPVNFKLGGGFLEAKVKYYRDDIDVDKEYIFNNNDLIVTMTDLSKNGGTLGYPALIPNDDKLYLHNQRIGKINIENKVIKKEFLFRLLCSERYRKYILSTASGTTVNHTSPSRILEYDAIIPTIYEQEKISSILSTVDEQIDNVNALIEKNKELKKGLMQTLLTKGIGHTKFKKSEVGEIPEEWEVKRIEEICEILDSKRIPLNEKQRSSMRGNIPYYGANAIVDYVNEYLFNDKLILIAEDGGNFSEFRDKPIAFYVEGKCWVNNHAHVLRANSSESTRWIFYNLVHKDITNIVQGGTRAKLNQKDLKAIAIAFPKLDEQIKIVNILYDIDKKIEIYISKKDKLEQLKKGLVQQLLTGKIRTV